MVFEPKVQQNKRERKRNEELTWILMIAENTQKMQKERKNTGCTDLGERENAGNALRILAKVSVTDVTLT